MQNNLSRLFEVTALFPLTEARIQQKPQQKAIQQKDLNEANLLIIGGRQREEG